LAPGVAAGARAHDGARHQAVAYPNPNLTLPCNAHDGARNPRRRCAQARRASPRTGPWRCGARWTPGAARPCACSTTRGTARRSGTSSPCCRCGARPPRPSPPACMRRCLHKSQSVPGSGRLLQAELFEVCHWAADSASSCLCRCAVSVRTPWLGLGLVQGLVRSCRPGAHAVESGPP